MNKIVLVGAGGHCRACIDVIEQENKFQIVGVTDKHLVKGDLVLGYPVLGNDEVLNDLVQNIPYALVVTGQIKSSTLRQTLYDKLLSFGFQLPVVISPMAYVAKDVEIGKGSIVMHGAIINRGARIGKNSIINTKALIEHDAVIGDYCHVSTGATINGASIVKDHAFIGSQAVVIQGVEVPQKSFVRANTLYEGRV